MNRKQGKKDPALLRAVNEILDNYNPENKEFIGELFYQAIKEAAAIGAEAGAEKAAAVIESEHRQYRSERFKKQYANTRLLLQHYRSLNTHYSNAIWESDDDEPDEFIDIMELMNGKGFSDTVVVDTIKKSSEKTRIIMRHVNKMLDEYRKQCENSLYGEDMRHWRVIKGLYLAPVRVSADKIAEQESINRRTVYKDVDAAVEDLTMLLFGVDGVEKMCE
jgi:hypothetical protein